jgi:hypothetical protein
MRTISLASALAGSAILFAVHGAAAQPAPPPPPGFPDYVSLLDDAYNRRDIVAYENLFQPDVKVFLDGALIASDRPAFLDRVKAEFARNLHISTMAWAQGSQILALQAVQGCIPDRPAPNTVYHGCGWSIAVRYDLAANHKIESVHILEAQRTWNMHPSPF